MEYTNFGKAGVRVSRMALGMGLRGQDDPAEAQRMIEHAMAQGINLIDCANISGLMDDRAYVRVSESIMGKAIKGKRDDVMITSKVAQVIGPGENDYSLSRYHIIREAERSLKNIGTDHIDFYICHVFDPNTPLEETVRALDDLVRSGKVRYIGCSRFDAWQVMKAQWIADRFNATPFMCVQHHYNLLNRRLEADMFPVIRDQGLGTMVFSPLAVGLLSGLYSPDQDPPEGSYWASRTIEDYRSKATGFGGEIISAVFDIARELGKTPAQVAIAWVLSHPEITLAITGSDTAEQLDDNLGGVGWYLDEELRDRLDAVSASAALLP